MRFRCSKKNPLAVVNIASTLFSQLLVFLQEQAAPTAAQAVLTSVGDTVEVNTPGGGKSYEILKVAFG